jgi:hypothetical protein
MQILKEKNGRWCQTGGAFSAPFAGGLQNLSNTIIEGDVW